MASEVDVEEHEIGLSSTLTPLRTSLLIEGGPALRLTFSRVIDAAMRKLTDLSSRARDSGDMVVAPASDGSGQHAFWVAVSPLTQE